ncbi:hypothetical protein BV95_02102 [Sphingobium chlorophenolicum]|uniref:Uncharacterized protein n=1 Tax=Sphingobium chlorophenolicum TaxID=46429 RepID=A0A081RES9_SPHCR|nr:hypothetical protein BV95_02102 [Sphingobium chlorophenolicum]
MPKRKTPLTVEEQAEKFVKAVRDMEAAGELNPTEADEAFERALSGVAKLRREWLGEESDQENHP